MRYREGSYRDDFFTDMVEGNNLWTFPFLKVTADCVPDLRG